MTGELEMGWENASSIQPQNPSDLRYIGTVKRGKREYRFYKDATGKYWYDSDTEEDKRRQKKKPIQWQRSK